MPLYHGNMMRRPLILAIVRSDNTFTQMQQRGTAVWSGKCIHCNSRLVVSLTGETEATVEHIVPLTLGGTDALDNVALACKRCNNLKGKRMDWRGANDPKRQALTIALQTKRQARWRSAEGIGKPMPPIGEA